MAASRGDRATIVGRITFVTLNERIVEQTRVTKWPVLFRKLKEPLLRYM